MLRKKKETVLDLSEGKKRNMKIKEVDDYQIDMIDPIEFRSKDPTFDLRQEGNRINPCKDPDLRNIVNDQPYEQQPSTFKSGLNLWRTLLHIDIHIFTLSFWLEAENNKHLVRGSGLDSRKS
ncbi:hypothetical protein V1477_004935 [Vespula maculifrons]|uniref:Uncharacterized protein n=1 Tax=Vespula maculifrons TaxID=7453 RepID=A0ABD2CN96_VESMC